LSKYSKNIGKYIQNYNMLKTQYKSIIDLLIENNIKLSLQEFVDISKRLLVMY